MLHRLANAFGYAVTAAVVGLPVSSAAANFSLYGYDSESAFGARSLFYKGGHVLLANHTSPDLIPIYFESAHEDGTETIRSVHANMTGTPPFSRGILQLPDTDDHQYITVQNAPDAAPSQVRILVYGHTILVTDAGILSASFYAEEADTAGVWYLVWEPNKNEAGNLERVFLRNRRLA